MHMHMHIMQSLRIIKTPPSVCWNNLRTNLYFIPRLRRLALRYISLFFTEKTAHIVDTLNFLESILTL